MSHTHSHDVWGLVIANLKSINQYLDPSDWCSGHISPELLPPLAASGIDVSLSSIIFSVNLHLFCNLSYSGQTHAPAAILTRWPAVFTRIQIEHTTIGNYVCYGLTFWQTTSIHAGARAAICELPYANIASDTMGGAGGTCVLRGCVPKKLMVYGGEFADAFPRQHRLWVTLPSLKIYHLRL